MLHAGEATAVAHCLIERVAGGGGSEHLAVAAAEALDAVLVEQRFGGGEEHEMIDRTGGALIIGVEAAQSLDLVAEEIEPQRAGFAGGEEIDDAAAHRIFAGVMDGVGAHIAV